MKYLVLKNLNSNKASDRLRISPWIEIAKSNGFSIIYWKNWFNLLSTYFKYKNSKIIFLLSKEFTLKGLFIALLSTKKNKKVIIDICDLHIFRTRIDIRHYFKNQLGKIIIRKSNLIIVPNNIMSSSIMKIYNQRLISVVPDGLDIKFLPNYCSIFCKNNTLKVGWFGTSGFKTYNLKIEFQKSDSFIELLKFIDFAEENKQKVEFILFTDNTIELKNELHKYSFYEYIKIKLIKYDINQIEDFFNSIEYVLLTYGDSSYVQNKSTNRLDTSIWLGKQVITYREPISWIENKNYTRNSYFRTTNLNEILSILKKKEKIHKNGVIIKEINSQIEFGLNERIKIINNIF